ncbi:unnamed protein product [Cunninghamella echinulata]
MPGIISTSKYPEAASDMTMFDSYINLEAFMDTNRRTAHHFTIDDDNHGVGILCSHKYNSNNNEERSATVVRLDKDQIKSFMTSYGFTVSPNNHDSEYSNRTFSSSGYICQLP